MWDWSTRRRLNHFCNGNAKGSSITALHVINQDVGGIILTGSGTSIIASSLYRRFTSFKADGIVRLYRNYDPEAEQGPIQMVSAFRALNEIISVRRGSGLILDWKQSSGLLVVGGDSRVIRLWDAHTETQSLVRKNSGHVYQLSYFHQGLGNKLRRACNMHNRGQWICLDVCGSIC